MIEGSGKPQVIIGATTYTLPRPSRNGRDEEDRDESSYYYDLYNIKRQASPKFRFIGTYRCPVTTSTEKNNIETLQKRIIAKSGVFKFKPYSDNDTILKCTGYPRLRNLSGYAGKKELVFKIEEIKQRRTPLIYETIPDGAEIII